MTRSPRAFRSVFALLTLWVAGRTLTMMSETIAEEPQSGGPEQSAGEDPVAAFEQTIAVASNDRQPQSVTAQTAFVSLQTKANEVAARVLGKTVVPPVEADNVENVAQINVAAHSSRSVAGGLSSLPITEAGGLSLLDGWSASGWLLYRSGAFSTNGLAANGQLGGSQTGVRVTKGLLNIGTKTTLGLSARASSALARSEQREVAIGGSIRVGGPAPVEIIAERRFGVDGGAQDRFVLLAATGVNDVRLPAKTLLSGYAQAGVAGVRSREGFVDGSVRVERPVAEGETYEVRLGANAWVAAQPGLSRVDIGPGISVKLRSIGPPIRVSAEWRQRVAGNASPASGPAITIGADF